MRYDDILSIAALKDPTHPHNDLLCADVSEFFKEGIQGITVGVYVCREPGPARQEKVQQLLQEVKEKKPQAINDLCAVIEKMGVPIGHMFNWWLQEHGGMAKYQ